MGGLQVRRDAFYEQGGRSAMAVKATEFRAAHDLAPERKRMQTRAESTARVFD
jgi:hypothetical protein